LKNINKTKKCKVVTLKKRDVGGSNLMTEAQQLTEECDENTHTHTDTHIQTLQTK